MYDPYYTKSLAYGFRFYLRTFPLCFIFIQITALLNGGLYGLFIFVHQYFFNSVGDVLLNDEALRPAFLILIALFTLMLTRQFASFINNMLVTYTNGRSRGEMTKRIHTKIMTLDPLCFEDTILHDTVNKAQQGSKAITESVSIFMSLFTFYLSYFIVIGFFLITLKPRLLWAFAFIFIPILLSQIVRIKMHASYEDTVAPLRRVYDYLYKAMTGKEYLKETRLLGGFSFLFKRFSEVMHQRAKEELHLDKKNALLTGITGGFCTLGFLGILVLLVQALLAGDISIGGFAAVFGTVGTLFSMMENLVGHQIGSIMRNLGLSKHFIHFMVLPEHIGKQCISNSKEGIIASNISFSYPQSNKKVIDEVSLSIADGEVIAIVGKNGAGKTTLVRILMGLYRPTEGNVKLHGLDTSDYCLSSLQSKVSGVFQRYQCYLMTLEENIRIGDVKRDANIDELMEQAGLIADSETLPHGAKTMLSREFGGVDLSKGQWQRIAIARGLYRIHDVIILDEPTATIDPLEENRIYRKFIELSKGKTAIIITHRLGSVKMADKVIVMDKGKIDAIGTHKSLLAAGGLYAKMYATQSSLYE